MLQVDGIMGNFSMVFVLQTINGVMARGSSLELAGQFKVQSSK